MKISLAVALIVTAFPGAALAGGASENSARERRVCTQITLRAGSQDDYEALAARAPNSWDGSGGIRPDPNSPGAHSPDVGGPKRAADACGVTTRSSGKLMRRLPASAASGAAMVPCRKPACRKAVA